MRFAGTGGPRRFDLEGVPRWIERVSGYLGPLPAVFAVAAIKLRPRSPTASSPAPTPAFALMRNASHVPWPEVDSVTSVVTLKRPAAELRLNGGDDRWATLVGKVPGS